MARKTTNMNIARMPPKYMSANSNRVALPLKSKSRLIRPGGPGLPFPA